MAQLMPLPLTVSCFSKILIGFTFLVPAHPGSHGKRAVKRVCVLHCHTAFYIEICFQCSDSAGCNQKSTHTHVTLVAFHFILHKLFEFEKPSVL